MTPAPAQATTEQLAALEKALAQELEQHRCAGLNLDLTRGKPSPEQLALADALDGILEGDYRDSAGGDLRNYGGIDGIAEAKALFADLLGVGTDDILVGGNSSLALMHLCAMFALHLGAAGPGSAWRSEGQDIKFIAPCPGYDRHFAICEQLGIALLPVAMGQDGPDMDAVESLLRADPMIKGIWCVPRFSNPTGCVYSDAVLARLARLARLAGPNFRVFCDNAYAVHALTDDAPALGNVMQAFRDEGTTDALYLFGSTSKMTFAGAGVAFLAMSPRNLAHFKTQLGVSQIGPDKINQMRHVRFLRDRDGVQHLMARHAAILRPRFDSVGRHLREGLEGWDIASWTEPRGGYFVSVDTLPGLATAVVRLAASAGVKLTPAGATYPGGRDPQDRNIRIAPSFPRVDEIDRAMAVFVTCLKLASVRQRLGLPPC